LHFIVVILHRIEVKPTATQFSVLVVLLVIKQLIFEGEKGSRDNFKYSV